jgi:gamma-carbonic anhydrase
MPGVQDPRMHVRERLQRYLSVSPDTTKAAFVAPSATVLGDVRLGADSSVWYGAVLRGDINSIVIGSGTNLQDGVIVHLADEAGVTVGDFTTVGHRAIIHACRIGAECLIGMGATVLDHAEIGEGCIIGANSLVTQRFKAPPGSLVFGNPARVIRPLSLEERKGLRPWAEKYIDVAKAHAQRFGSERVEWRSVFPGKSRMVKRAFP